jgi:hypothetical protein
LGKDAKVRSEEIKDQKFIREYEEVSVEPIHSGG